MMQLRIVPARVDNALQIGWLYGEQLLSEHAHPLRAEY